MMAILKLYSTRYLTWQFNFALSSKFVKPPLTPTLSRARARELKSCTLAVVPSPTDEGMVAAARAYNPLSRWRERVGERGKVTMGLPISLLTAERLTHAK